MDLRERYGKDLLSHELFFDLLAESKMDIVQLFAPEAAIKAQGAEEKGISLSTALPFTSDCNRRGGGMKILKQSYLQIKRWQ